MSLSVCLLTWLSIHFPLILKIPPDLKTSHILPPIPCFYHQILPFSALLIWPSLNPDLAKPSSQGYLHLSFQPSPTESSPLLSSMIRRFPGYQPSSHVRPSPTNPFTSSKSSHFPQTESCLAANSSTQNQQDLMHLKFQWQSYPLACLISQTD